MKQRLYELAVKAFIAVIVLLIGASLWYYTVGRKPHVVLSSKVSSKESTPSSHVISPGELLVIDGSKMSLFDTDAGVETWSVDSGPVAKATAAPAPAVAPERVAHVAVDAKHDPSNQLHQARLANRSAKLNAWAAQLNARRNSLDTPLKAANFKQEEARYQAEAAQLSVDAGTPETSAASGSYATEASSRGYDSLDYEKPEVLRDGATIWIVKSKGVRIVDHANGRITKEFSVAGKIVKTMRGAGCVYVLAASATGAQQLIRIGTDGALKGATVKDASVERFASSSNGTAGLQQHRTEVSATGAELVQLDVRLLHPKITERQALKQNSAADWEEADKNTTGGWSSDAAVIARAMADDAQREVSGGKERIDESDYEIVLRRPFDVAVGDSTPLKVQGRPELFSTKSFDLVVAGQTLIAFDRSNKKVWQATLAFPAARQDYESEFGTTTSPPCAEDEKHLYFFDRGCLTAFDRQNGAVVWRLPSVGIRKLQLDSGGLLDRGAMLYVVTQNGSAESLRYSQEATAPTEPLLLKVEASSGKVVWKLDKYQDCYVSDGNIYVTLETRNGNDLVNSVFERGKPMQTRFKVYKLSAFDGKPQWEWFEPRRPLQIAADKKKLSLLFLDELQVLRSRAL